MPSYQGTAKPRPYVWFATPEKRSLRALETHSLSSEVHNWRITGTITAQRSSANSSKKKKKKPSTLAKEWAYWIPWTPNMEIPLRPLMLSQTSSFLFSSSKAMWRGKGEPPDEQSPRPPLHCPYTENIKSSAEYQRVVFWANIDLICKKKIWKH